MLHPSIIVKTVEKSLQQLQSHNGDPDTRREGLRKALVHVEAELARLATVIATGGSMAALLSGSSRS